MEYRRNTATAVGGTQTSQGIASEVPRDKPGLELAIERQRGSVCILTDLCASLEKRLSPIMRPSPQPGTNGQGESHPVPLVSAINDSTQQVELCSDALRSILERLEL